MPNTPEYAPTLEFLNKLCTSLNFFNELERLQMRIWSQHSRAIHVMLISYRIVPAHSDTTVSKFSSGFGDVCVINLNSHIGRPGFATDGIYFAAATNSDTWYKVPIINGKLDFDNFVQGCASQFVKDRGVVSGQHCQHTRVTHSGFGTVYCNACPAKGRIVDGVVEW
jgi:hypothetical protein